MAEYTPLKIRELVQEIDCGRIILPAMQRNFVWSEDKICHLFDSIMRDYPIGTFLFWNVDDTMFKQYAFNTFIKDYDEGKGKMQRGERATAIFSDYKAVLDGQQRITSLYMGLRGKYHTHTKGKKWDDPTAYFDRWLCVNALHNPKNDDIYHFAFKKQNEIESLITHSNGETEFWVSVEKVFNNLDIMDFIWELEDLYGAQISQLQRKDIRTVLQTLQHSLLNKPNINYYLAKEKSLSEVVEVFVRVNSGGEKLSASDLMLSVAAGEQGDVDIHVLIQNAVESINAMPKNSDEGFKVDKEVLLRGGLLFTGAASLSLKNNDNYTSTRMNEIFKDHWESIVDAFKAAVTYIEYLGFIGQKLPSKNLILPIAYYFYKHGYGESYKDSSSNSACCDRIFIRQWLLRTMFNNVFSDGIGSTLLQIRKVIDESAHLKHFPLERLMEREIKKSLDIGAEQIEDILDIKYGDSRIKALFCEMLHRSSSTTDQVDHIWPKAILMSKKAIRRAYPTISEDDIAKFQSRCNCLSNLQLLDHVMNQQKSDTEFELWIDSFFTVPDEKDHYMQMHFIPKNISYKFSNFLNFYEARYNLLYQQIANAFPSDFDVLVHRYNLQNKI